jgi:2,4-dienoyl-CoA reductase (NADPH2)
VQFVAGVHYERIDAQGLHVAVAGQPRLLEVDTIIVCAGQEPARELVEPLTALGVGLRLIGGADVAAELDAKRAIAQGAELAASL